MWSGLFVYVSKFFGVVAIWRVSERLCWWRLDFCKAMFFLMCVISPIIAWLRNFTAYRLWDIMLPWPLASYYSLSGKSILQLAVFLFLVNRVVILLSKCIVVVGTYCPSAAKYCLVHNTCPIKSSMANNSASLEFFFCFYDALFAKVT